MLTVTAKTRSPSPFLHEPLPKSQNPNPKPSISQQIHCFNGSYHKPTYQTERGLQFETEDTFFRHESATGRDLGVLSAALYKQSKQQLRVLDVMCGCGIRSLRYLAEAKADFVMANDGNDAHRRVILGNLKSIERGSGDEKRWVVTHFDANRVLSECYLKREFFDLIDIDSFGSDSSFLRTVFNAVKRDGLLYLTSTDGYSSGGHRPNNSLASYGAYILPMPYSNEIGLRMLIGGAVREASAQGYHVSPLFSYYSYHGPVFRVMLRVHRKALPDNSSLVVSGPLWTGPLHDATHITKMLNLAEKWGWVGDGTGTDLEKLLSRMIDESDPRLPFGYIKLDEMASRAKMNSPSLKTMMSAVQKEGYVASRSHIASNAIKTNCPMVACIRIAKELQGCQKN
ncbi:tRNA (guanine(26)-N(2))-dimethyltransferase [Citrus sinensis]|nr:tRNA (guanine(26)-N(2))-dimethyltransferase [Citrus sinensis]